MISAWSCNYIYSTCINLMQLHSCFYIIALLPVCSTWQNNVLINTESKLVDCLLIAIGLAESDIKVNVIVHRIFFIRGRQT
jgi:hypothetical protein